MLYCRSVFRRFNSSRILLAWLLLAASPHVSAEVCNNLTPYDPIKNGGSGNHPINETMPSDFNWLNDVNNKVDGFKHFDNRPASTGSLNFQPHDHMKSSTNKGVPACIREYSTYRGGTPTRWNQTPFLLSNHADKPSEPQFWQGPQLVPIRVGTTPDGKGIFEEYWHIIVDDSANGMELEYYIQAGFVQNFKGNNGGLPGSKWSANWGGNIPTIPLNSQLGWSSASAGDGRVHMSNASGEKLVVDGANAFYPLAKKGRRTDPAEDHSSAVASSGSGSANPNKVIVRQKLAVGELTQEYLKYDFDKKPLIIQQIADTRINATVAIDMSNLTYSQDDTPGIFGLQNKIYEAGGPPDFYTRDFAFAPGARYGITAGRYTYTEEGYNDDYKTPGGSNGDYTYVHGNYDIDEVNWSHFMDFSIDNRWGYGVPGSEEVDKDHFNMGYQPTSSNRNPHNYTN